MNGAPIGVFDSGVGGLTVAAEIRRILPGEDLIYFADTAHCPYGKKTMDEVIARSSAITEDLLERGAKIIVVACNSASGAALQELRRRYPVPFVGMVPGIKPACEQSRSGRIGVLATALTVHGGLFTDVVTRFASECRLTVQTCPGLAEAVERGEADSPATISLLRGYLGPLRAAGVDAVVLGCTHYPFLKRQIRDELGDVVIVDSSEPVAKQVRNVLVERGLLRDRPGAGEFSLIGTGDLTIARHFAAACGLSRPALAAR